VEAGVTVVIGVGDLANRRLDVDARVKRHEAVNRDVASECGKIVERK
jgi:hypothetical protein